MDRPSIQVYEPVLAIDNVEVAGVPVKITCIECCGSRMFIGTLDGTLLEYFITDEKTEIHFTKVRHTAISRTHKNQPIMYIRAASAIDTLLILSGSHLALFDIETLEIKGSNGIGNVTAVAIDENPISGDPFLVELCFSRKSSISLGQATEKGFTLTREINVDSLALSLSMESGLICAALANGYYVMINSLVKNSKPIQLCSFDPRDKPRVAHVKKEEFLVLGPGGLGVFVTKDGSSERPPISWPDKMFQMTVHNNMNVVGIGEDSVYVHSLIDFQTCHTIVLRGVKCLALSEGNLYVGTSKSLFRLKPISIEQQIEALLAADEIEKAFGLIEVSHLKEHDQQQLLRKIHQKAVFIHISNLNLDSAADSVQESGMDLREVVSLFPNLLPSKSSFTRSFPALHDFVDIESIAKGDAKKLRQLSLFMLDCLRKSDTMNSSVDLSTALFKLAVQYDQQTFQKLLKVANQMPIDLADLLEWLENHQFYSSEALLYKCTGEIKKALDIWVKILAGKVSCASQDEFSGIEVVIATLVDVPDPSTVWTYFEKLVQIDPVNAVQVFIRKPISSNFPPLRVSEGLRKWPEICIIYLEDCISSKDIQDEDCHTYLASLYIDQILQHESTFGHLKEKLKQFLIDSNCLKLQFLIGRLSNTKLRHELAIVLGKAGDHNPALLVFTRELNDHKMAREYCTKLNKAEERKRAFLELLRIYLESPLKEPSEEISNVLDMLSDFSEEFDLTLVLSMLPDDWSVHMVSSVLQRAMRKSLHRRRRAEILAGLSTRIQVDYHVEAYNGNQGYMIDSDSICEICHKTFDLTDPIFYTKGLVVHENCK